MKKKLILQLRNSNDVTFLEEYGDILFYDDIADIVIKRIFGTPGTARMKSRARGLVYSHEWRLLSL